MRERIGITLRYLKYFFNAKTKYQVHSPFVYTLVEQILEDRREYYAFSEIESLRNILLRDSTKIEVTDFGAGSHRNNKRQRSIRQIAKTALSPSKQCRQLFRLVQFLKPKTILEMGTSFGITASYQATAARNAQIISLEGCPEISKVAKQFIHNMKLKNIELITGKFADTLEPALQTLQTLDYVFIDGHHQKKPTLDYFEKCLPYAHEKSVFVFDDIHWSAEMEEAWENIKHHPEVSLTIDLFFMGIVFFRKDQKEREHFQLISAKSKPWNMGFFR